MTHGSWMTQETVPMLHSTIMLPSRHL
jgi:hypothetical protein